MRRASASFEDSSSLSSFSTSFDRVASFSCVTCARAVPPGSLSLAGERCVRVRAQSDWSRLGTRRETHHERLQFRRRLHRLLTKLRQQLRAVLGHKPTRHARRACFGRQTGGRGEVKGGNDG